MGCVRHGFRRITVGQSQKHRWEGTQKRLRIPEVLKARSVGKANGVLVVQGCHILGVRHKPQRFPRVHGGLIVEQPGGDIR